MINTLCDFMTLSFHVMISTLQTIYRTELTHFHQILGFCTKILFCRPTAVARQLCNLPVPSLQTNLFVYT